MDARLKANRAAILLALLVADSSLLAANYRTRNFLVTAPTDALAQEVGETAENLRRDLALEWIGQELPAWPEPCPILARIDPQRGAGGKTNFFFRGRTPYGWQMEVDGSRERVLDSVLPHEITHTIFAMYFGQPLPRWADEGGCTSVEHEEERAKHDRLLIRFLTTQRGIAFNRMFRMMEYPREMLPLYSQGYSVARFLIEQRGKPAFIQFVGDGLQSDDWDTAVRRHYSYDNLSVLQLTWMDWVKQGSPFLTAAYPAVPWEGEAPSSRVAATSGSPPPSLAAQDPAARAAPRSDPAAGGWYSRRLEEISAQRQEGTAPILDSRSAEIIRR